MNGATDVLTFFTALGQSLLINLNEWINDLINIGYTASLMFSWNSSPEYNWTYSQRTTPSRKILAKSSWSRIPLSLPETSSLRSTTASTHETTSLALSRLNFACDWEIAVKNYSYWLITKKSLQSFRIGSRLTINDSVMISKKVPNFVWIPSFGILGLARMPVHGTPLLSLCNSTGT